jgi:hypothetical protein
MKYLRRKAARKCAIHKMMKEAAREELIDKGYFNKAEIFELAGIAPGFDENLRWDYIIEFIEEEENVELVPVAKRFFEKMSEAGADDGEQVTHPKRFMAVGHGKRTVGYCNAEEHGGSFIAARIENSRQIGVGFSRSAEAMREKAIKCGIDVDRLIEQQRVSRMPELERPVDE